MENLSPKTKIAAGGGGGVVLAVAGTSFAMKWWAVVWFLVILIVLLLIVLGIYFVVRAVRKKKQGRQMYGDMEQNTTAAPRGMNANKLGQLDDLRKKFQEGVQAFKSRGKDIYALPWYVVVGEPGSGKTEAVRHCNVGFPPGMQDAFQGAGGTINMNWWFTNQAVLLDTAGRLMFEEIKTGENSEWNEFLKLLKKNRPRCPINGMLLVIPSDSLIKDTADRIEAKAGKIAQQFDTIQRILDVRFPVYVVVTKSDKVNGFREYFEGITDPTLQHQMMGWSNSDPLDTPFRPAEVEKHLQSVSDRLRKRRLGMLRDPIPEDQAHRRVDEVDALFAFPESLTKLAPRLRKYLETIFTPGEWSSKPLFLRGIYFTSSMREGSELDQDLAEALGLAADQLPEGRTWEKERAYFLKDVFIEKAFRERGLVTNVTNTSSELRKWKIIFYAFTFVMLTVFMVFAYFGYRDLRSSVGDREKYWSAAASAMENKQTDAYQMVVEDPSIPDKWSANSGEVSVAGNKLSVGGFHSELRRWVEKPIEGKWYLPGIGKGYEKSSREAQQVFFERTVIQPLVESSRISLGRARGKDNDPNRTEVLLQLMRLESDILIAEAGKKLELKPESASNFVASLFGLASGEKPVADSNIVAVMVKTYPGKSRMEVWPPAWLSGTTTNKQGAVTNEAIFGGLDAFIRGSSKTIEQQRTNFQRVLLLGDVMGDYRKAEDVLLASRKKDDAAASAKLVEDLNAARRSVENNLASAQQSGVFSNSLVGALGDYRKLVVTNSMQAFASITTMNDMGLERSPTAPIFLMISNRLNLEKNAFIKVLENEIPAGAEDRLKVLDAACLVEVDGVRAYAARLDLYTRAAKLVTQKRFTDLERTKLVAELDALVAERNKLVTGLGNYSGPLSLEASNVCSLLMKQGFEAQMVSFAKAYSQAVEVDLKRLGAFPLAKDSALPALNSEAVHGASKVLASIVEAMSAPRFESLGLAGTDEWKTQLNRAVQMKRLADWLVTPDKTVGNCTVTLLKMDNELAEEDDWRGKFRAVESGGEKVRTNEPQDQKLAKVALDQGFKLSLFMRPDDAAPTKTLGADAKWQLLRATLDSSYRPKAVGGDRKSWHIFMPVEGEKGSVRLRLDFEQALPTWP